MVCIRHMQELVCVTEFGRKRGYLRCDGGSQTLQELSTTKYRETQLVTVRGMEEGTKCNTQRDQNV